MKPLLIGVSVFAGLISIAMLGFLYLPDGGLAVRLFIEEHDAGFRLDLSLTTALLIGNVACMALVIGAATKRLFGRQTLFVAALMLIALACIVASRELITMQHQEASSAILMIVSAIHGAIIIASTRRARR